MERSALVSRRPRCAEVPNGYISSGVRLVVAPQAQLTFRMLCSTFVHSHVVARTLVPGPRFSDKEEVPGSSPGSPIWLVRGPGCFERLVP